MSQLTGVTIVGVMWIVLGGMQLLSGAWAAVMSVLMVCMAWLPQAGPIPWAFRAFFVAAPFASMIQCTLAGLFVYGGVRLTQHRPGAGHLLRVLSSLAIGFAWACGVGMAALGMTVASGRQDEATAIARWIFSAMPIAIAMVLSIPPLVTIKVLAEAVPDDAASEPHATGGPA